MAQTIVRYLFIILSLCFPVQAFAHDPDYPEEDKWYETLMQPDNPESSCCGIADAYWCDSISIEKDPSAGEKDKDKLHTFCTITDNRDDALLHHRPHVPIGTKILIPDYKLKWDKGNPTGHAIVFLSRAQYVFCFIQGTGT